MNIIFYKIKLLIQTIVNRFGFYVVEYSDNFMDEYWCSPAELIYKTHKPYILLKVPIADVRFLGVHAYKAGANSSAPFIHTIKEYINGTVKSYTGSSLFLFYEEFQPKSISEYLYLDKSGNEIINNTPASGVFFPWENINPIEKVRQRANEVENDNKEHNSDLKFFGGDPFYGPVSIAKGELEYNRLVNVYKSILKNDFKIDLNGSNNIFAIALEKNNEYRYLISSGQHRVAALSVLEYKNITLLMYKNIIVRRSEVEFWPGVKNGYFSKSEALKVFDRIFSGKD